MATTTPNFGWPVPTSTDLVKDGAVAIEALGDAVDASLLDLKGGTTGQVLSKTSNTDMDFTWVAADDTNAIQNAIVDAKGDLIAASAADTPARLAVGANGTTLVADSTTATGLRWQGSQAAGKNAIINGGFDIWQRGTSVAVGTVGYTADRYYLQAYNSMTVSRQLTGDTTNLPFITYSGRVQRNSGTTGVNFVYFTQTVESLNSRQFAGQTVTFSYYARKGANFSGGTSIINGELLSGTGTDQGVLGFTGSSTVFSFSSTLTTTWQRFTFTGTVPSTSNQLGFYVGYTPVGTAGANDWFEITGIQLEAGSVATTFTRAAGTIQEELAACQRYYIRWATAQYERAGLGVGVNAGRTAISITNPVQMRIAPSAVDYSTLAIFDGTNLTAVTSVTIDKASPLITVVNADVTSGVTQYRPYQLFNNNSATGYIGLSAEL